MTHYTNKENLINSYGLCNIRRVAKPDVPEGDPGYPEDGIDMVKLNSAMDSADSIINGYLAASTYSNLLHTFTGDKVPNLIETLANVITYYFLHDTVTPELTRQRYQDAIRTLENISTPTTPRNNRSEVQLTYANNTPVPLGSQISGPVPGPAV